MNTEENQKQKINKKDFQTPLLISIPCSIIMFLVANNLLSIIQTREILKSYSDVIINFGLTLLGFSVTSFALMQLLVTKDFFERFRGSILFPNLLFNFKVLIVCTIINFFYGLALKIFIQIDYFIDKDYLILSLSIFFMIFTIVWAYKCVAVLIKLVSIEDEEKDEK